VVKAGEVYKPLPQVVGTIRPVLPHSDGARDLSIIPLLRVRANNLRHSKSTILLRLSERWFDKTLVVRYSGKRLGTATSCSQGFLCYIQIF